MGAFSNFMESMRYLLADIIGEQDDRPAFLPENLPEAVVPVASEAIHLLTEYQGTPYARVYVYRLRRFIGKPGVDDAMLGEIARLMAVRMSYEDPIRIAQQKLIELETEPDKPRADDIRKFRLDELIDVLPAVVAEPILDLVDRLGWVHKRVSVHFNNKSWLGIRRLKMEASLRRWRRYSIRYGKERVWVERWLHMVDRALTKQPGAAREVMQTATMVQGYGDTYRHGLADWHAIIDGLAKPVFDGVLSLPDLAGAIAEARAAALPDPRQAALKRKIAEIRARALGDERERGCRIIGGPLSCDGKRNQALRAMSLARHRLLFRTPGRAAGGNPDQRALTGGGQVAEISLSASRAFDDLLCDPLADGVLLAARDFLANAIQRGVHVRQRPSVKIALDHRLILPMS